MKKGLIAVLAIAALGFASCKKDYTCTCTITIGGVSTSASSTIHDTKKKATDACTALATAGGTTYTCAIK